MLMKIIMAILWVIIVVLGCWLAYIIGYEIYCATLNYESHEETAIVVEKKFKDAYTTTTYVHVGKVSVPQIHHHDEEYNVYVDYEGVTYRIDDNDLFEKVEIGESIEVTVNEGYNRRGQVKNIYLTP